MSRIITVGAAQMGPIQRTDSRHDAVTRMIALLEQAAKSDCDLVVFPELALTTFFPRWFVDDITEADHWYEREMPSAETRIVGRYHKVHIPGHEHHEPGRPFQHAERYYFEPGPEGFGVWKAFGARIGMMICNDRRWPESYRVMGLKGVELILCGYNTPIHYVPDPSQDILQGFHNSLVMQSGAYQNGTWVAGVAKGGVEEGVDSLGQSAIIAPSGQIVAQTYTTGDELLVARCDLDWCARYKDTLFDFDKYRRPEVYGPITAQRGAILE